MLAGESAWMAALTTAVVDADETPDPYSVALRAVSAALPGISGAGSSNLKAGRMTMEVFTAAHFDELTEATPAGGSWAGRERRIVAVAASLAADTGLLRVNLPGRYRDTFLLILAAVSHAGGRHESTWLIPGDPFG